MNLWSHVLSILFPESAEVERLHALTQEELWQSARAAPDIVEQNVYALFSYSDKTAKALIWRLKYKKDARAAALLGSVLATYIEEILEDIDLLSHFENPLFVPVPLSHGRQRQRGYNQCSLLIEEAQKLLPFEVSHAALRKIRETAAQTTLKDKKEREKNLSGCFEASEEATGRNVILIDDVTTTGSTFREATAALKAAGAREVIAIALAR